MSLFKDVAEVYGFDEETQEKIAEASRAREKALTEIAKYFDFDKPKLVRLVLSLQYGRYVEELKTLPRKPVRYRQKLAKHLDATLEMLWEGLPSVDSEKLSKSVSENFARRLLEEGDDLQIFLDVATRLSKAAKDKPHHLAKPPWFRKAVREIREFWRAQGRTYSGAFTGKGAGAFMGRYLRSSMSMTKRQRRSQSLLMSISSHTRRSCMAGLR